MHTFWQLLGIFVAVLALAIVNWRLVKKWPTIQNIIYCLLLLLGVFLSLASLGILPDLGG